MAPSPSLADQLRVLLQEQAELAARQIEVNSKIAAVKRGINRAAERLFRSASSSSSSSDSEDEVTAEVQRKQLFTPVADVDSPVVHVPGITVDSAVLVPDVTAASTAASSTAPVGPTTAVTSTTSPAPAKKRRCAKGQVDPTFCRACSYRVEGRAGGPAHIRVGDCYLASA